MLCNMYTCPHDNIAQKMPQVFTDAFSDLSPNLKCVKLRTLINDIYLQAPRCDPFDHLCFMLSSILSHVTLCSCIV